MRSDDGVADHRDGSSFDPVRFESGDSVFVSEPRKQTGPETMLVTQHAKCCNRGCVRRDGLWRHGAGFWPADQAPLR